MITTTDPTTLPALSTWYLTTNLPAPGARRMPATPLAPAALPEIVRIYGLRMWVEQSYKQVKHALGWAAYQVRSDRAIRRHWQLVMCAFCFCWWAHARALGGPWPAGLDAAQQPARSTETPPPPTFAAEEGKNGRRPRPTLAWPAALCAVRAWLEPWQLLQRYWRAWSDRPPPPELQALLAHVQAGRPLFLYDTS